MSRSLKSQDKPTSPLQGVVSPKAVPKAALNSAKKSATKRPTKPTKPTEPTEPAKPTEPTDPAWSAPPPGLVTPPEALPPRVTRLTPPGLIPTTFFPTLLPSLLGESSPELCWEWHSGAARVAARLTQFGWNASAYSAGSAVGHWRADSLEELRSAVLHSDLPAAFSGPLGAPWVLAYDSAGFE